ncbi:sugar ABC transporter permease [Spirochaetia bacterium]|nr:sugar ABC transporter permease [Spirochaetia bacterium]
MNSGKFRIPAGLGFLLPGLAGFILFFIAPFGISLVFALMDKPVGGSFAGLRNFAALFQNKAYLRGLFNTVRFIGISVPLNMALSLGLAMLINKMHRYREYCTLIFLIPLVIPSGSMVFFWKSLFSYNGALNGLLHHIGIGKINWLDSNLALPVMILIFIWKNAGYNMVLFLAGLHNIPKEYYEAAWMDSVGAMGVFRYITMPCLMPTSVLVLIMSIINSFKIFREIYLITGTYPHGSIYTLQHFMNNMFVSLNYPRLCAATAVLVFIITLCTQTLLGMERKAL